MKKILPLLLILLASLSISAQRTITQNAGRNFYLTSHVNDQWTYRHYQDFDYDYYTDAYADTAVVYVMGKQDCSGYVENPQTGYREDFTVTPFTLTEIKIPENQIMCDLLNCWQMATVLNKGIYLHTEEDVYVFMQSNFNYYTMRPYYGDSLLLPGKMQILPVNNFSDEVTIYPRNLMFDYCLIGTEDDTEITATFTNGTLIPQLSTSLNKGEVYVLNLDSLFYFYPNYTNIRITSNCKPFVAHVIERGIGGNEIPNRVMYPYPHAFPGKDFVFFFKQNGSHVVYSSVLHLLPGLEYTLNYYNINPYISENEMTIHAQNDTYFFYNSVSHGYLLSDQPLINDLATWYRPVVQINPYNGSANYITFEEDYPYLPADQMVLEAMFCAKTQNLINSDSLEFTVLLVITPQDTNSTYLNGELIDPSSFSTMPGIEDRYYFTSFKMRNNIPDILHFENSNGLMADVREEAFYCYNNTWWWRQWQLHTRYHSGGNPQVRASLDEIAMSPVFCLGDTLMLRALYNHENHPVDWIVDDIEYENQQEVRFPIPNLPGDSLLVTMIIHRRCPDTVSQMVYIDLPPVIANLPQDTMICRGAAITLQTENATLVRWSDGTEGITLTAAEAGTYYVAASNDCHITATDSIRIAFFPEMEIDLGNDTLLCQLATLLLDASHPHATGYYWQDASTLATYTVRYDGDYWVVVTDPCGVVADSINVGYLLPVSVNLGNDTTLCDGDMLLLLIDNPYCDYVWQDGSTSNSFTVTHEGIYSVTATNLCYAGSDEIAVHFENCRTNPVYVPTAVSPDGNGVNDLFLPVFEMPDKLASYEMLIYNRWGTLLFQTRDPLQGWDAANAPAGSYVYFIRYKSESIAEKMVKGTVVVVR